MISYLPASMVPGFKAASDPAATATGAGFDHPETTPPVVVTSLAKTKGELHFSQRTAAGGLMFLHCGHSRPEVPIAVSWSLLTWGRSPLTDIVTFGPTMLQVGSPYCTNFGVEKQAERVAGSRGSGG